MVNKMEKKGFGINLTNEEKNFMGKYCFYIKKCGSIDNFPLSDEEKKKQYLELEEITKKLTSEELVLLKSFLSDSLERSYNDHNEELKEITNNKEVKEKDLINTSSKVVL